ncbi:PREDICTED: uncharacterized protein LOC105368813 [Ceratosolen solmsi marchali]|uniref:Uncharacterized protein LOC105368813 n=1 Tax=Ceratosolen solmsi marchali TaxID=326594 RepID=A0AAJ7E397_9HYME|nr:PREDICTED: uncharacterized protein LOC105368813 [Ceratosolen solmsi marchali]
MDLVYIPEVLTFGSFRSPQYRDYEQPWNRNYFDDGKAASYHHHRQLQQHQQQNRDSGSKDSCHLCKENKRRSLAAYIRGKTRNNSCNEICEEEEEVEAQEKPNEQPEFNGKKKATTSA